MEIGAVGKEIDVEREGIRKEVEVGKERGKKRRCRKKKSWKGSRC